MNRETLGLKSRPKAFQGDGPYSNRIPSMVYTMLSRDAKRDFQNKIEAQFNQMGARWVWQNLNTTMGYKSNSETFSGNDTSPPVSTMPFMLVLNRQTNSTKAFLLIPHWPRPIHLSCKRQICFPQGETRQIQCLGEFWSHVPITWPQSLLPS